jgi:hypothetical protein
MAALLYWLPRGFTEQQDRTAQRDALLRIGVRADRIDVHHGLTGTNRERPGLREALAACRAGDTSVVTSEDGSGYVSTGSIGLSAELEKDLTGRPKWWQKDTDTFLERTWLPGMSTNSSTGIDGVRLLERLRGRVGNGIRVGSV